MKDRLNRIEQKLMSVNRDNPWFGEPLETILASITLEQATFLPEKGGKSISHYLSHLIQWRLFCLRKIKERTEKNIVLNSEEDWPLIVPATEKEWVEIKNQFVRLTDELLEEVRTMSHVQLDEPVPGKTYTFEYLLDGIIDHDLYHFGQISLLRRLSASIER